ncbi:hypothetical protein AB0M10_15740 [Streptomyces sp. NPDC051840]|uniref:hypothetical protein n=1 Tax=Streptomyces sp. NPDC051840 TaxID=3154752 RepID=UPI00342945C7
MTFYDWAASLWRTAVPLIAGWVVALLVHVNLDVDEQALSNALVSGFAFVYYGLFRTLESKVSQKFGWFLGLAKPPVYPARPPLPPVTGLTPYGQPPK